MLQLGGNLRNGRLRPDTIRPLLFCGNPLGSQVLTNISIQALGYAFLMILYLGELKEHRNPFRSCGQKI